MATSAVSDAEREALRFHLCYGNVSVSGYPYTPDGFIELFRDVVQPNLTTGEETTATTAIAAGAVVTVTPVAMTGISVYSRLMVDVGDAAEIVVVKAVTGSTFSAAFVNAHTSTGYPVAVFSAVARLRMLLHSADRAWAGVQGTDVGADAGIKKVDETEFYQGGKGGVVLEGLTRQYETIVASISSLVRVPVANGGGGRCTQLEAY